jgi:hypothetical protein
MRKINTTVHKRINSECKGSYLPSLYGSTESTQNCSTPKNERRNIDINQVIENKYKKELKKLCTENRQSCGVHKKAINIREYLKH